MKALLDAARTFLLCGRQLRFLWQRQDIDGNDKGLLVDKLVAPRPDEYVGERLTWLDAETFADIRLELWGVLGMI